MCSFKSLKYYLKNIKNKWGRHKNDKLGRFIKFVDFVWRKEYRIFLLLLGLIGSIYIIFIEQIHKGVDWLSPSEKIQITFIFLTGIIVFWYSRETKDLKEVQQKELQEVRKQRDYELKPYLKLKLAEDKDKLFYLSNEGRGIAVDVEFKTIKIVEVPGEIEIKFNIKKRPALPSKSNSTVSIDEVPDSEILESLRYYNATKKFVIESSLDKIENIIINYKDIEKNEYEVRFKYDENYNDKFKIINQEKLTNKLYSNDD